jgi:hypothetical protein
MATDEPIGAFTEVFESTVSGWARAEDQAMRLPRMRFTVRSVMFAIAVVAIAISGVLWGRKMRRLSGEFARAATANKQLESQCREFEGHWRSMLGPFEELARSKPDIPPGSVAEFQKNQQQMLDIVRKNAVRWAQVADHHAALKRKYERAARYPWLSVDPDPPRPE